MVLRLRVMCSCRRHLALPLETVRVMRADNDVSSLSEYKTVFVLGRRINYGRCFIRTFFFPAVMTAVLYLLTCIY